MKIDEVEARRAKAFEAFWNDKIVDSVKNKRFDGYNQIEGYDFKIMGFKTIGLPVIKWFEGMKYGFLIIKRSDGFDIDKHFVFDNNGHFTPLADTKVPLYIRGWSSLGIFDFQGYPPDKDQRIEDFYATLFAHYNIE